MTLKRGIIVSKLLICFLLTISRIHAQNLSFSAQISNNNVTSACANTGITFSKTTTISSSDLKWDFGDGYTVTNTGSISHSFANSGTFTVQLIRISTNEVSKKVITIFKNPISSFTVSDTSACSGSTISFISNSTRGEAEITSYQWTFGDGTGLTSNLSSADKVYNLTGNFSPALVITDNNGCSSSSVLKKPIVINGSNVTPSFQANGTSYYSCDNSIQFINTSTANSASTISYVWDLGDGTTINNKDIGSHTYINKGIYTVKLKASSDGVSCTPTFSKTVYIGEPDISITSVNQVCESSYFSLNAKSNVPGFINGPYDVQWQISNGNIGGGNTLGIFRQSGSQTITATNVFGCPSPTTKTILVNALPDLDLSIIPSSGFCLESKLKASVSVTNGIGIKNYIWYPEGESGPKDSTLNSSFNYQYTEPGGYNFTLKAMSTNGCVAMQSTSLVVQNDCIDNGYGSAYNPYFSFTSESCDNKYTILLKNKYTGSNIDHWVYKGISYYPNMDSLATITLTPASKDSVYSITSIYKNRVIDSSRKIIIIDETADFDITNNDNSQLYCATNTFTFNSEPYVNSGNIAKYQWQIKNSLGTIVYTSSLSKFSFAIPAPDNYTISLTITDITSNACTSTQTKTINVQGIVSDFSATTTSFCKNGDVTFTSQISTGTPLSKIVWSFGDGTPDTTIQTTDVNATLNHSFTSPNGYRFFDIKLVASDNKGCSSTITKASYIKIYSPKANFSSSDTLNCTNKDITINNISNARNGQYNWVVGPVERNLGNTQAFSYSFGNLIIPSALDVYLKVIDEGGCTSDTLIKNYIKFVEPIANFKILNEELLSTCPPYTLKLLNTSSYSDSAYWSINNSFSSIQPDTVLYSVLHPGILQIKLNAYLDGCSSSHTQTDTILGPIASLSINDTIGCAPYTSNIIVSHNNDVVSYQWDTGDSTFLSKRIDKIAYVYNSRGTYNPFVVVTGQEGCSDKLEYPNPVIVGDPTASIKIADSIKFCYYDSLKFLNISEEKDSLFRFRSFTWHWGNTTELNNSTDTIKHLFQQSDTPYNVYVTGVTDYCTKNSDTLLIQPFLVPQISIGGSSNTCLNDSLRLYGIVSNTENANNLYTWSYDSTEIQSSNDSSLITVVNPSQTQIHLKVSTEKGCVSTISQALGYWNFPTISIDSADPFCTGSSIQLQAHSNGTQYTWTSTKNISGANSLTPLITPDSSTYYYLSVSDLNNCKNHDSIYVKVDQKVNLKYVNSFEFCLNDTVPLILKTQTDNVNHFTWTSVPSNGFMSDTTGASIGVIPAETTTYHVIAYSGSTCPDESGDILVKGLPFSTVTFDPHLIESSAGTYLTLNPLVTNEELGVKYFWTPNTRLSNPYLKNPEILTDNNIVYKLVIKNDNGCTASDTIAINVKCTESKILMANAFTPNGDGTNDRFYVTGYGIKNVDHFIIVDRWGKKVFEQNNIAANDMSKGWDGKINGHLAAPGTYMYFAQIECSEGNKIPLKGSVVLIR